MRLFLASSIDQTLDIFVQKTKIVPSQTKIAFVDLAAEPYKNKMKLFWVINDKKKFLELGFEVEALDLRDLAKNSQLEIQNKLSQFQIIHFCGGHARYLLAQLHRLSLLSIIKKFVAEDKLIYTGTSASSMIVAPTLLNLGRLDDEIGESFSEAEQIGLNLVNFVILPHFNNPDFILSNYDSIQSTNYPYPLIFLNDSQAILVEDDKFEIVIKKLL